MTKKITRTLATSAVALSATAGLALGAAPAPAAEYQVFSTVSVDKPSDAKISRSTPAKVRKAASTIDLARVTYDSTADRLLVSYRIKKAFAKGSFTAGGYKVRQVLSTSIGTGSDRILLRGQGKALKVTGASGCSPRSQTKGNVVTQSILLDCTQTLDQERVQSSSRLEGRIRGSWRTLSTDSAASRRIGAANALQSDSIVSAAGGQSITNVFDNDKIAPGQDYIVGLAGVPAGLDARISTDGSLYVDVPEDYAERDSKFTYSVTYSGVTERAEVSLRVVNGVNATTRVAYDTTTRLDLPTGSVYGTETGISIDAVTNAAGEPTDAVTATAVECGPAQDQCLPHLEFTATGAVPAQGATYEVDYTLVDSAASGDKAYDSVALFVEVGPRP